VFFDGTADDSVFLKFKKADYAPYFEDLYAVDDVITVTFSVYDINYSNVRIIGVVLPELTDAEKLLVAKAATEVPATVTSDLTVPTEMYGVTITGVSANTAITNAGVVTRPANGAGDVVGDLTATFTIGALTEDKVFSVTVSELPAPVSGGTETFTNLDIAGTSYAAGSFIGDLGFTWSYTESRGDFVLTGQAIMLDKDGDCASLTATITGGIGSLSVDFYDAYSGAAQVTIIINEGLASEVTYTSVSVDFDSDETTTETFVVSNIDISGEFTISVYSAGSQMVIDNLVWTGFTE
jgi:hypothetical protein